MQPMARARTGRGNVRHERAEELRGGGGAARARGRAASSRSSSSRSRSSSGARLLLGVVDPVAGVGGVEHGLRRHARQQALQHRLLGLLLALVAQPMEHQVRHAHPHLLALELLRVKHQLHLPLESKVVLHTLLLLPAPHPHLLRLEAHRHLPAARHFLCQVLLRQQVLQLDARRGERCLRTCLQKHHHMR
jgi:hypothetical protein